MNATAELKPEERQRCEIWTRVMGYHRPTSSFNAGKKAEHAERKFFTESQAAHGLQRSASEGAGPAP
jgi:hypothetical protein